MYKITVYGENGEVVARLTLSSLEEAYDVAEVIYNLSGCPADVEEV